MSSRRLETAPETTTEPSSPEVAVVTANDGEDNHAGAVGDRSGDFLDIETDNVDNNLLESSSPKRSKLSMSSMTSPYLENLPPLDQVLPCSCLFFLGYETCCAIFSALGCFTFIGLIVTLIMYLDGKYFEAT